MWCTIGVCRIRGSAQPWRRKRRRSALVADAPGWALHQDGRDAEALHYATTATSLGWHNADPHFFTAAGTQAVAALTTLGGPL